MVRRVHVSALLLSAPLALAVRKFDLTATDGELKGKYAFDGGENEATCKGCMAVMQHVEREMEKPDYDEGGHFGGRKTNKQGSRAEQAAKLNLATKIGNILDAGKCMKAMKQCTHRAPRASRR